MKSNPKIHLAICALVPFALIALGGAGNPPLKKAGKVKPVTYAQVAPLLKAECLKCHNDKRKAEGVNVTSYKTIMAGAEHGPIVVAGHPEQSSIITYVDGTKNPRMPMGKPPLTKAQIKLLSDWVKGGAKA